MAESPQLKAWLKMASARCPSQSQRKVFGGAASLCFQVNVKGAVWLASSTTLSQVAEALDIISGSACPPRPFRHPL